MAKMQCSRCEDSKVTLTYKYKEGDEHILYCYCTSCGEQHDIVIEEE
jgi:hypothetical protein